MEIGLSAGWVGYLSSQGSGQSIAILRNMQAAMSCCSFINW